MLTTFGLTIALGRHPRAGTSAWHRTVASWQHSTGREIANGAHALPANSGRSWRFLLIVGGLATKIGWAPVHNWLPDAHSEAPPPVSALLSAALLPTVILIAWRVLATLGPALRGGVANATFIAFGLSSLAIAVPFLWRPLGLEAPSGLFES